MKHQGLHKWTIITLLALLMLIVQVPLTTVFAEGVSYQRIVDPDTSDSYIDKLISDTNGSKNAGRMWADKSVYIDSVTLDNETDGVDATIETDSDFLHAYSLLSSSQLVNDVVPLDVMFVLDISGSMGFKNDGPTPGIPKATAALNQSIKQLLEDNPESRFGIVVYSSKAAVILDLGYYSLVEGQTDFVQVNSFNESACYNLTFRIHDDLADIDRIIKVSNNDQMNIDLKTRGWNSVVRNYSGFDFIVDGGETNIQSGIKAGLEELANVEDTIFTTKMGNVVSRIPAMILLSDGSANTMAEVDSITSTTPIPEDHNFVDVNGAKGSADINFTTFDLEEDFGHSNNYFDLYGFHKELDQTMDNTVGATVSLVSDDKPYTFPGYNPNTGINYEDNDPIVLSTLLTASYYTSAVNNNYKKHAVAASATNINNVSLKNYTIFASTSGALSSSDINMDVVNKVMNPEKFFTSDEVGGNSYKVFNDWVTSEDGKAGLTTYTYYSIGAYYEAVYTHFFQNGYSKYLEKMDQYDAAVDGDYQEYDDYWYNALIDESCMELYGVPLNIRTQLDLNISDEWLNNPANNPYGITPFEVKNNIYYLPSKNALTVSFEDVEQVFSGIISELTGNAFLLTSGMNSLGVESSVTYMDPIGDYMDITGDISINGSKATSDMALVLNGNINPVTKGSVYNYQFNNAYVSRIREEQNNPNLSFPEGWYKGDDPATAQYSSNGSWKEGYVYRIRYETAINFIPTLKTLTDTNKDGTITADDISDKQKNTVYTLYGYSFPGDTENRERDSWRINPAYLSSQVDISDDDLEKDTNIIKKQGMQEYYTNLADAGLSIPDGIYRLSDIRIWVEDTGDYNDSNSNDMLAGLGYSRALYINIPASAIPTQIIELSFEEDDQTINYKTNLDRKNESTPLRLYYSVGADESIKTLSSNGIDLSKVSKTYIDAHKNEDNQVYFLSNYYSANAYEGYDPEAKARTRGDPVLTFSPEIDNRYYVFQHYHTLYTNIFQVTENNELQDITDTVSSSFQGDLKINPFESQEEALKAIADGKLKSGDYVLFKANAARSFDPERNYFTILNQYAEDPDHPGKAIPAMTILLRSGKEFTLENIEKITLEDMLCWYNPDSDEPEKSFSAYDSSTLPEGYVLSTKPGSVRVGRMSQSIDTKGESTGETYNTGNYTHTANNFFLPTLSSNSGSGDNILVNIYLGNDGKLVVDDTLLFVTKLVADKDSNFAHSEEQLAHKDFDYQLYLEGFNGNKSAIKVQWDEQFQMWRRRISTIDVITDNNHFLQTSSYKLVRADAQGNVYNSAEDINAYPYYVYVVNAEDPDNTSSTNQVIRVYSAVDNNDPDNAPSGSRERKQTGVDFNAGKVLLVPVNEVTDNWTMTPERAAQYQELSDFTVATMEPELLDGRTNGLDLVSPYLIRSEYLTVDLNFGLDSTNDLFDDRTITIRDTTTGLPKYVIPSILKNYTAQFSLKHGEGLLFNGIPSGAYYRITENLSEEQDSGWKFWDQNERVTLENAEEALKVAVKHLQQKDYINYDNNGVVTDVFELNEQRILSDNEFEAFNENPTATLNSRDNNISYSVTGETGNEEEGVQFVNTTETSNLTIAKNLKADSNTSITDIDKDLSFKFDISLNYSVIAQTIDEFDKNSVKYKYSIFDTNEESNDETIRTLKDPIVSGYLVSNFGQMDEDQNTILMNTTEDGEPNNTWTVELKHGQVLKIYDLLIGTEYSVSEEPTEGFEEVLSRVHEGAIEQDAENFIANLVVITNKKINPSSTYIDLNGYKSIWSDERITPPELEGEDFSFTITPEDTYDQDPISLPNKVVKNDKDGKITFFGPEQLFVKSGVYSYIIEESEEYFKTGITKDLTQYRVVVTIEEDYGKEEEPQYTGKLKASYEVYKINGETEESWSGRAVEYINQYKPLPTTLSLEGTKTYLLGQVGENLPELSLKYGDFNFRIAPAEGSALNTPLPEKTVVPNDENGRFEFSNIRYTEPGTYKYTVREALPEVKDENIIYDSSVYIVTVVVRDNEEDKGTLKATATIEALNNAGEVQEIQFTNYHKSGDLIVEKTVSGAGADSNEDFAFRVDLSDKSINTTAQGSEEMSFTNGSALFTLKGGESKIARNLPAGITYTVEETDAKGYTTSYSSDKPGDIKGTNNIKGSLGVGTSNNITVNNHKAGPVETTLSGIKTLENQNVSIENSRVLTGEQFSFILERSPNNPETDPVPEEGLYEQNDTYGAFVYDLTYSEPGSYTYTLSEVIDHQPGFIYDHTRYQIDIEVIDDGKSDHLLLNQTVTKLGGSGSSNQLAFKNIYSPAVTSIILEGDKEYVNGTLTGGDFDFLITPVGDAPIPESLNTTNDSLGHFSFGNIIFDHEGVFTYEINEINKVDYKILYSDLVYEAIVTVFDNGGMLEANVQYQTKDGQAADTMRFTNILQTGSLEVSKTVTGSGADLTKSFDFRVVLDDDSINGIYGDMTFVDGVANFALRDGEAYRADNLPIDIQYTVSEVDSEDYIVYKSGEVGTITSDTLSEAKFTNRKDAYGGIEITKTVIGTLEDKEKTFDFTVTLYSDEALTDIATQIHGTYGDLTFDMGVASIELKDSQKVTAQDLPINLFYKVEELENEGYIVTSTGETGQITQDYTAKIEFVNERENAEVVLYPINVQKAVVGTPADEAVFTFSMGLKSGDPDGVILPQEVTTSLKGAGYATFDPVTFTKAGTYTFSIAEINIPDGYRADDSDHDVTIVVNEDSKHLKITNVLVDNSDQELLFTNYYEVEGKIEPNVGILKLHKQLGQEFHADENNVSNGEMITYKLSILNNGNATAHNLIVYDALPETLDLMTDGTVYKSDSPENKDFIDLLTDYNKDSNLIIINDLNGSAIDLDPGQELIIEYEVMIPTEIDQATYWTNHSWLTYDELENKYVSSEATDEDEISLMALSLEKDFESLRNYDLIDTPIELGQVETDASEYHSLLHDNALFIKEIGPKHVIYSNDVREYYEPVSNRGRSVIDPTEPTDPDDPPTDPDDPPTKSEPSGSTDTPTEEPETVIPEEPQNQTPTPKSGQLENLETSDNNQDNKTESSPNVEVLTPVTVVEDMTSNQMISEMNTTITTNTEYSTTGVTEAPKTGIEGMSSLIWLIVILGVIGLVLSNSRFRTRNKN